MSIIMMTYTRKVPSFALLLLFLGISGLGQALPGIEFDSLRAVIQLAPGEGYNGAFQIRNTWDQPLSLRIALKDFVLNEDGAFVELDPGTLGEYSLANYITYTPDQVTLGPGESQTVNYSITLPPDALGPHWAGR